MSVQVEIKYNVGDEVFYFKDDKIDALWKGKVSFFTIKQGNFDGTSFILQSVIKYSIDNKEPILEERVFLNKKEAEDYCIKICKYYVGEEIP